MSSSQEFLDQLYRRIVFAVAFGTLVFTVVGLLVSLTSFLVTANILTEIIAVITFIGCCGCAITLFLVRSERPLWQAILSFGLTIILSEIAVAIWLPELRLAVAPFLAVVILLAGLQGDRRFTFGAMAVCATTAVLIVALGPEESETAIPNVMLTFLRAASIAALIVAVWAFLDRILMAQLQALQIADQRADEAEAARQATETARREIEQRAEEQQRLLDLVTTLELPVLTIDDQVLLAPLVGNLDSRRAEALRQRVLETVATKRAHTVILDVSGIVMIDTAVAKALMDTVAAIRLLGARAIISGIRPAVAQTLVHLNASFGDIVTAPNPEAALSLARRQAIAVG